MDGLAVVCVGGGSGRRYGGDKLAERLQGQSVFARAVAAVSLPLGSPPLVVVAPPEHLRTWRDELEPSFPNARFVAGGVRRQDSVRHGVEAAAGAGAAVVVVHDAARPLVHRDDVVAAVSALGEADGAVLCAPIRDTVKRVAASGEVVETLDRERLRAALTPQVFRVVALRAAWAEVDDAREWTDEAAMLEAAGRPVRWVDAVHPNPKLTVPEDMELLGVLVRRTA